MSTRLQNKTALVTGSSQGLGRAIALSFAHHGAYLVVCADLEPGRKPHITLPDKASEELSNRHNNEVSATQRTTTDVENPESAGSCKTSGMSKRSLQVHSDVDQGDDDDDDQHATHKLICKLYGDGKAVFVECDVGKEEGERGMKRAVEEAAGRGRWGLNIFVNAASLPVLDLKTHETTVDQWEQAMSVNARGTFLGCKYAVQRFLSQELDVNGERGCIINVTSVAGFLGIFECGAYCASKASSQGLTRAIAIEYASRGIRCNAIAVGYIESSMLAPFLANQEFSSYLATVIPARHLGRPKDVAHAAVWLGNSAESAYVNGVILPVDGAFSAR